MREQRDVMTEKQKQLAADNHNLIYSFLNKHNLNEEEYYDLAAIGLCKAAKYYKDDVSKFSTYAFRCMINTVLNEMKTKNLARRIPEELVGSYNNTICGENGEEIEFIDILPCDIDFEKDVIAKAMIDNCMRNLSEKNRLVFTLLLDGYTHREIADIIGFHHSNVSKIRSRIVRMMNEE